MNDSMQFHPEMMAQAFKGLMAALDAGSGLTRTVTPVQLPWITSEDQLFSASEFADAVQTAGHGSVITIASKLVSVIQGRRVIDVDLYRKLPTLNLESLATALAVLEPGSTERDALILDIGQAEGELILSPLDPNGYAHSISARISSQWGISCDTVIVDSGAGADKGLEEIGIPTFFATPLGCTRGLLLVQAQRCAVAAEYHGNLRTRTPVCVITPESFRSRERRGIGGLRYNGYLDASREELALPVFLTSRQEGSADGDS